VNVRRSQAIDEADPTIVEKMFGYTYFVVPRESLVSTATGDVILNESQADGGCLPAVMASSSLRAHANVNLLPLPEVDAILVGSAVTPLSGASGSDGPSRQALSSRDQKTMLLRIRSQLQMLGMDMTHASSVLCVALPLLSLPSRIGLDTSLDVITQGYAVLPRKTITDGYQTKLGSDGEKPAKLANYTNVELPLEATMTEVESPNAWHVIGGGAHHSRRAAADIVDRVETALRGSVSRGSNTWKTQLLTAADIGAASTSLRDSIAYFVNETFALTVSDIVARRTKTALLNPQQCSEVVVPAVAEEMQKLLGWSNSRKRREIADARALLEGNMLSF